MQRIFIITLFSMLCFYAAAQNVGIGTQNPNYKLDVSGDINTTGLIRLNGNAGIAGQVLGSNGTVADPSWVTTSYSNNTRFCVGMYRSDPVDETYGIAKIGGTLPINYTVYNLNTTNVTIGANSITINKSGLYHFEALCSIDFNYVESDITPSVRAYLNIGDSFSHDMAYYAPMYLSVFNYAGNTGFKYNDKCSLDIYISAPKTISLYSEIVKNGASNETVQYGQLYGHLISE